MPNGTMTAVAFGITLAILLVKGSVADYFISSPKNVTFLDKNGKKRALNNTP